MHTLTSSLRVIWACLTKDLNSARSEPLYTLVSIILPLNVLVLMSLLVISGGWLPRPWSCRMPVPWRSSSTRP